MPQPFKIVSGFFFLLSVISGSFCQAQGAGSSLLRKQWKVDGVTREALVYLPSSPPAKGAPVLFVFHGHGGTMGFSARANYERLWPEAVIIYPQGLPISGHLVDKEGVKAGWQFSEGEVGDRDLKFFDAMLASAVKEYHGNPKNVFTTGHSNGARFSQLLWAARGEQLRATAASASSALNLVRTMKPKPYLQITGENDPLVPFRLQKASFNALLRVNGCSSEGRVEKHFSDGDVTAYSSNANAPTLLFQHHGTHTMPTEGPQVMVDFFKKCVLP